MDHETFSEYAVGILKCEPYMVSFILSLSLESTVSILHTMEKVLWESDINKAGESI